MNSLEIRLIVDSILEVLIAVYDELTVRNYRDLTRFFLTTKRSNNAESRLFNQVYSEFKKRYHQYEKGYKKALP